MSEDQKSGCFKYGVIGCISVSVLMIVSVSVLVAVNFDSIREFTRRGQAELSALLTLQQALQEEYGAIANVRKNFGTGGASLIVEFVNPPFEQPDEAQARVVARFARDHYAAVDEIQAIHIIFAARKGIGVTLTTRQSFSFSLEELASDPPTNAAAA